MTQTLVKCSFIYDYTGTAKHFSTAPLLENIASQKAIHAATSFAATG